MRSLKVRGEMKKREDSDSDSDAYYTVTPYSGEGKLNKAIVN